MEAHTNSAIFTRHMKAKKAADNPFELKKRFIPAGQKISDNSSNLSEYWFTFQDQKLLVKKGIDGKLKLCTSSPEALGYNRIYKRFFGYYGNTPCFIAEIPEGAPQKNNLHFQTLRSLFGKIDEEHFNLAGRAIQVLHHHHEHQFCSRCGSPMVDQDSELAKSCPSCKFISFPRVSPAVIMAVSRGNQILLGRAPGYPEGMYSTLAGFVELGETLEEAVKREVLEETNIKVNNVRYMASQPWPFPHSIMVGYTATFDSGEIKIDPIELEDAQWFSVDKLPKLPSKISIARLLIDDFIKKWR